MIHNMPRPGGFFLAFLVSFLLLPSLASAATYYVSTSGSDSNPGTSASPWRTIQEAANTMVAGDTTTVNAGTYTERINVTRSGSSGARITYQTQGKVITKGFNVSASYVKVDGFEIANSSGSSIFDRANGSGVYLSGSNGIISNTYIHDTSAAGMYLTSAAGNNTISTNRVAYAVEAGIYINGTNHLILSNDISHTRSVSNSDADGIRFFGSGTTIRKNYIHDIKLSDSPGQGPHIDGMQTWGPASNFIIEQNLVDKDASHQQGIIVETIGPPISNITIRNNIIITRGTDDYNIAVYAGGVNVTNTTIVNNTMVALGGPVGWAVWIFANTQGAVVKNNAIYNHGDSSSPYIQVDGGSTGIDIGYNSVYKSDGVAPAGGPKPNDLWMVDPKFVAGDVHLQSVSPLINAGITVSSVTNDYDGNTRPQGSAYDIGAYENVSAASFNYSLSNSGAITATQGSSGATTITATLSSGAAQSVSYAASGLPTGATASFSSTSCNPTCSITLTINATASTPAGSSAITVTGSPLSKTTSFILTVPPAPSGVPHSFYLEAESGTLVSPMVTRSDTLGSGGSYISSATNGSGTARYTFTVPAGSAGTYYVWGRVLAPAHDVDSFYVSMDSGTEDVYDMNCATPASTSWQWAKVNGRIGATTLCSLLGLNSNTRTFSLTAGSHTLKFQGREANAKLDRLFITNQANSRP